MPMLGRRSGLLFVAFNVGHAGATGVTILGPCGGVGIRYGITPGRQYDIWPAYPVGRCAPLTFFPRGLPPSDALPFVVVSQGDETGGCALAVIPVVVLDQGDSGRPADSEDGRAARAVVHAAGVTVVEHGLTRLGVVVTGLVGPRCARFWFCGRRRCFARQSNLIVLAVRSLIDA